MKKKVFLLLMVLALVVSGVTFAVTSGSGTVSPTAGGVSAGGIAAVTATTSGQPVWTPIAESVGSITAGDLYSIDTTGASPYTGDLLITLYLTNPDQLIDSYTYFTTQVNVKTLSSQVVAEAVGTGNASTTVFYLDNAPVNPTTLIVYLAGVAKTEGTDYTVNYVTGTITFTVAPGNTVAVTADYWYYNAASGTAYKQAATANGTDITDTYLTLSNGYVSFVVAGDSGGVKYRLTIDDGSFYCISTSGTLSPSYFLKADQA